MEELKESIVKYKEKYNNCFLIDKLEDFIGKVIRMEYEASRYSFVKGKLRRNEEELLQQELCSLVEKSARIQRRMCLNLIYIVKKIEPDTVA